MIVRVKDIANPEIPTRRKEFGSAGFAIGRIDDGNSIFLGSPKVAPVHARVDQNDLGWAISVHPEATSILLSFPYCRETDLKPGEQIPLFIKSDHAEILVASQFQITLDLPVVISRIETPIEQILREIHTALLRRIEIYLNLRQGNSKTLDGRNKIELTPQFIDEVELIIDELMGQNGEFFDRVSNSEQVRVELMIRAFKERLTRNILNSELEPWNPKSTSKPRDLRVAPPRPMLSILDEGQLRYWTAKLTQKLAVSITSTDIESELEKLEAISSDHIYDFKREATNSLKHYLILAHIKNLLFDITFDKGPLSDLLRIPNVTEIMVVRPTLVFIEQAGKILQTNATFFDEKAMLTVVERIISPLGRRFDRSQPLLDARLPDGSRVNATQFPITPDPTLTIRRFPSARITTSDLVKGKSLSPAGLRMLSALVTSKTNIVVAGGTGSGKTTLLNVMAGLIPTTERIVTIEDAAELRLPGKHVITMEAKPPNTEGVGAITIRDLVKNALRMRPDRIVVGECRGGEALDMLQAMNTGHPGSLTTLHANNVEDVASRLETMVMMVADMPIQAIRRQIAQAVNIIIFVRRLDTGQRFVEQISEVTGLDHSTGEVKTRAIMSTERVTEGLKLCPTGYMPSILDKLISTGGFDISAWFREAAQ